MALLVRYGSLNQRMSMRQAFGWTRYYSTFVAWDSFYVRTDYRGTVFHPREAAAVKLLFPTIQIVYSFCFVNFLF